MGQIFQLTLYKDLYGERFFHHLERDYRFFAAGLSEMDLGNVDTGSVSFCLSNLEICIKNGLPINFSPCATVYCKTNIA